MGINPSTRKFMNSTKGYTLGDVIEIFAKSYFERIKPSSIKVWDTSIQKAQSLFSLPIAALTEDDIRLLLQKIEKDGSLAMASGVLMRLKQVLKFAMDEKYILKNPLLEIKKTYSVKCRERYLTPPEIKVFFDNLFKDKTVKPVHKLAIYCLLILLPRREELMQVQWVDIDLNTGKMIFRETKFINDFTLILPSQIHNLLVRLRVKNKTQKYLFAKGKSAYTGANIYDQIIRLSKKYGVDKFSPHDLRRTGTTNLAELGHDYFIIDSALMHVHTGIKKHYLKSHLMEPRRVLLQAWADYIDSLLCDEVKPVGVNWL